MKGEVGRKKGRVTLLRFPFLDTRPSPRNTRGYLFNIVFALAHCLRSRIIFRFSYRAHGGSSPVHRVSTQQDERDVFIRYVDLSRLASLNSSWTRSHPTFNPAPIFESSFHDILLGRRCKDVSVSVTNIIPPTERVVLSSLLHFFFLFAFPCNEQCCEHSNRSFGGP